ncbi:MAG: ATP synthase F1 subunit gamma [Planctomycetota bacterium]
MANVRDLKKRIKSVGNIAQITRAMEMVATTKLRKFQDRAVASRPYAEQIARLVEDLAAAVGGGGEHPLFEVRPVRRKAVLVVTSNRGLCGSYNSNVFAKVRDYKAEHRGVDLDFFVIGRKGMSFLSKRDYEIELYLEDLNLEKLEFQQAAQVARAGARLFKSGRYDALDVVYTAFVSSSRFEPSAFQFLPLVSSDEGRVVDTLLEPDPTTIFESLVPRYLETRMFNALIESLTSEFAMRRISMKNATDAANDMRKGLTLEYNRARQERITKELLEIVGGAEALRG